MAVTLGDLLTILIIVSLWIVLALIVPHAAVIISLIMFALCAIIIVRSVDK